MLDIVANHVSFSYDEKLILSDISMDVKAGSFVCLLGPSGCGKSTLLRLLAGLEKEKNGEIFVDGKKIEGAGLQRGVVFQDYGLFPWMTAGENITIALKQRYPKMKKEERKEKALEKIADVGLDGSVFDKLPKELSGGMKQRCAIARAFGIDPPVLLMDEPFAALDAVTRAKLQDLVLNLWKQEENRKTVFFVTHDVDEASKTPNTSVKSSYTITIPTPINIMPIFFLTLSFMSHFPFSLSYCRKDLINIRPFIVLLLKIVTDTFHIPVDICIIFLIEF